MVVIGYGSMKKSDLTGAVTTVKTEDLPMAANTSISHMLSGKAAGITSVQNSAQPGGGVTLRIRGEASTGAGNEPLYIIDGFPVGGSQVEPAADNRYSDFGSRNPLNSINPNDIESIEILKMLLPRLFTEQELRTVLSSLRLKRDARENPLSITAQTMASNKLPTRRK